MKRFLIAGVLALCLMTSQIAQAAQDRNAQIKAEMVQNYLLWQEAYKLRDAERIISFESPDFTRVFIDKSVRSKERSDASWRIYMKEIVKFHEARVEIKRLAIEPTRVVVLSKHHDDVNEYLWDNGRKQLYRIGRTFLIRDTWVQYDRVWMLKRSEQLDLDITLDKK